MALSNEIQNFWFAETSKPNWFIVNENFDNEIKQKFAKAVAAALAGEYDSWGDEFASRLSLILLLDQMPRNIYRGTPQAFSGDAMALALSQRAVAEGQLEHEADDIKRSFLLLPMMHSEVLAVQERSIPLFKKYTNENALKFAHLHLDIIKRFGRFPHRNSILGRESTQDEIEFLKMPNSSF